jgi:nucleotide-binding universal stress UspA family protein
VQRIVVAAEAGADQPWLAQAEAHTVSGRVVRALLLFAEEHDADLIVAGASTRGPIARRLLGTVPIELIRRARRPVLVVTPPVEGS